MLIRIALVLLGVNLVYVTSGDAGQEAEDNRQKRILAAYSTRTVLSMTTTTIASFYTCAIKVEPSVCVSGRKMRRFRSLEAEKMEGEAEPLDSSLSMDLDLQGDLTRENNDGADREGRIALTIWSTTTTPYTWTESSTDPATTFSISYWCSIVGAAFPPACG